MLQDSNEILSICQYLKNTGKNSFGLEYVTELALKNKKADRAWIFLQHLKKLRSHYFWPLLLNSAKEHGEIGMLFISLLEVVIVN